MVARIGAGKKVAPSVTKAEGKRSRDERKGGSTKLTQNANSEKGTLPRGDASAKNLRGLAAEGAGLCDCVS